MCRTPDTETPPRAASALLLARPALRISASPHRHGDERLGITTTTPLTCWITSQPGVESDSGSEASVGMPAVGSEGDQSAFLNPCLGGSTGFLGGLSRGPNGRSNESVPSAVPGREQAPARPSFVPPWDLVPPPERWGRGGGKVSLALAQA